MTQAERPETSPSSSLRDGDSVQECFALAPPMVTCLVRHIDRAMAEVTTPPIIERCVVELQSYFQPHIDASRVVENCVPGSKLQLQFGKAMDINAGTSSSLLHVYILAVDQPYSRPRLLSHVVKKWRTLLEGLGQEGSAFVMLYHQDLVDAASFSTQRASGLPGDVHGAKEPDQRKADAAVAALEPYFEELKALHFAPHQMCAYLPNEAPIRIVERLRAVFAERTARLTAAFDSYQQRQLRSSHASCSNSNYSNGIATGTADVWDLHEWWRRGYELAIHLLHFGAVSEAMKVFAKMFSLYYYHSEDYGFLKSRATLARLGKLPNVFDPRAFLTESDGSPSVLLDEAEILEGLLFIVACEIWCALQLGLRNAAFARYKEFLQVAREKFAEETTSKVTEVWELFFLLRCALSAMRLNWNIAVLGTGVGDMSASVGSRLADTVQHHQVEGDGEPSSKRHRGSLDCSETLSTSVMNEWGTSVASLNMESILVSSLGNFVEGSEAQREGAEQEGGKGDGKDAMKVNRVAMTERLLTLCRILHVSWCKDSRWMCRLLTKLSTDALEFLVDLAAVIGYRETGEMVVPLPSALPPHLPPPEVSEFGMPEIASVAAFASFYRTLAETSAIGYSLLGDRRLAHELYYKCALSYRVENPAVTAELCRQRLIPFCRRQGWLQLQAVVHCLFVESMDLVMRQREEICQPPLNEEETVVLKESILYIIGALNERGALREEIYILCGRHSPATWWRRLREIDSRWKSRNEAREEPSYSLSLLLRDPHVFCLQSDSLREKSKRELDETTSSTELKTAGEVEAMPAFPEMQAKLGDTFLLHFHVNCLVDILGPAKEEEEEGSCITLTAMLASKKDWTDPLEPIHLVDVTKVVHSSYNEERQRVQWVWEFHPCRAGEYHLLCITLRVGMTTLVYVHDQTSTLSAGRIATPPADDVSSSGRAMPRCLLLLPEPDIGIRLHVSPPNESHCFGDMPSFFRVRVEMERPLSVPQDSTTHASLLSSAASAGHDGVGCKNCSFDALVPPGSVASTITTAMRSPGQWDSRHHFMTEPAPEQDPRALALIYVHLPRRHAMHRPSLTSASINAPAQRSFRESTLLHDVAAIRRTDTDHLANSSLSGLKMSTSGVMVSISDEKTGALTTVPVNEQRIMAKLPTIFRSCRGEKELCGEDGKGDCVNSMHLEGSVLLTLPRPQCCFKICLNETKRQHQQEEEKENLGKFLGKTRLECLLPVLPIFMSSTDECAQVSLCCQREMESCTTSVSVPFGFAQAFNVQYAFKCFQSRVYCLVQVENVLNKTSLWLRGAFLELLDTECYYKLTRVSFTHERLMLREWKPHETMHLFFELTPCSDSCIREKEVCHRVRLQLIYSSWSMASEMTPLDAHILRPMHIYSGHSSGDNSPDVVPLAVGITAEKSLVGALESHQDRTGTKSVNSSGAERPFFTVKHPQFYCNSAQLEKLRATCNTFQAPVGTFTSKHSCLFNAIIFVDPQHLKDHHWSHPGSADDATRKPTSLVRNLIETIGEDSFDDAPAPVGASPVDLPGGCVFPIGEPIRFSVALEPLAHNWPENSDGEEEFFITFKADPSAWLVTGKQRLRRVLSMMEEETLYFTAVPVPALFCSFAEREADRRPHGREDDQHGKAVQLGRRKQKLSVVPTPTIEMRWASRNDANGEETNAENNMVAIDVVQFRTSMRIRH
ncbi:hypothetical protein C3747_212g31 [Trypanosoma cruzi]|uniref:Trafficking protein particle complex subunit 10 n=2 Tax=Trypanosoma cruzi TaxID=5693 RepID=A0A2V2VU93_TRYCR|nr:hypothetical protein C3747_212g31 [Trypanosoma cruzi]RNC45814.1 hypothetical protein TcCL_NonESM04443 [Trypanosoma cruzi]